MQQDAIKYEILEDGTISVTTDEVSGTNHVSADKLLRQAFELAGGPTTCRKRTRLEVGVPIHEHEHGGYHHRH
jgi:hypothetical protein